MNRYRKAATSIAMIAVFVFSGVLSAAAQRANTHKVRDAVRSLNSKLEDFEYNIRFQLESSSASSERISDATDDIRILRDGIRVYEDNLDSRRENRDDVNRIIEAAKRIDQFLKEYPQNRRVEDDWQGVRTQIDRLSSNYGVTTNWNTEVEPPWDATDDRNTIQSNVPVPIRSNTFSAGLSGIYELDATRSENINDVMADISLGNEDREDLRDKLIAPQQITLDVRGDQVTLGTSNSSPVTVTADGRDKTERSASGKTIRLRATLTGDVLTVSSLGGDTDYTIVFTSIDNGRGLKVSRRITTDYLEQTMIAESIYNRTGSSQQIATGGGNSSDPNGTYSDNDQPAGVANPTGRPNISGTRPGNYGVPNGLIMTGVLENEINTKVSQNNDRFRLTVQSPIEFRGAVIEGYISGVGRSGKVTGESNVTFNFEKITLRNGQSYDFAGSLQSIKDHTGRTVKIDNEGTAKGGSQTRQTVKRGGIGAGIGALIGAIAGGGKGAAIGAILGGGAGAGSVIVQGKDDIRLQQGSTITLQSSAPNQPYPR